MAAIFNKVDKDQHEQSEVIEIDYYQVEKPEHPYAF